MKRFCFLCGDDRHYIVNCPDGNISANLTIGEWIHVYLIRRFGQINEAAIHYRVTSASLYMALKGKRSLPTQLLKDSGVTATVHVNMEKP